jgi:MerR family transcriptional regulator/heat shock protein HspR
MEEMNLQMQSFVDYVRTEMLSRMQTGFRGNMAGSDAAIVPLRKAMMVTGKMMRPERKH